LDRRGIWSNEIQIHAHSYISFPQILGKTCTYKLNDYFPHELHELRCNVLLSFFSLNVKLQIKHLKIFFSSWAAELWLFNSFLVLNSLSHFLHDFVIVSSISMFTWLSKLLLGSILLPWNFLTCFCISCFVMNFSWQEVHLIFPFLLWISLLCFFRSVLNVNLKVYLLRLWDFHKRC